MVVVATTLGLTPGVTSSILVRSTSPCTSPDQPHPVVIGGVLGLPTFTNDSKVVASRSMTCGKHLCVGGYGCSVRYRVFRYRPLGGRLQFRGQSVRSTKRCKTSTPSKQRSAREDGSTPRTNGKARRRDNATDNVVTSVDSGDRVCLGCVLGIRYGGTWS